MRRIAFLILVLLPYISSAQFENDTEPYLIRVQGEFIAKQMPENVVVIMDIAVTNKEYKDCFENALKTSSVLKNTFTKNGIKEESIKTKDFSVQEDYVWEKGERIKKGYKASVNMEIENAYNNEFTNNLLRSLRENTFEVNYIIRFSLSDKQKEKLRQKAIEESVKDAINKANTIAKASNVELGEIYKISYGTSFDFNSGGIDNDIIDEHLMIPIMRQQADPPRAPGIDFNPQEIAIKKTIIVEWKIKK